MKVLITGGTGTIGGLLTRELQERGTTVRVLTRKTPEAGKVPSDVEIAVTDRLDPTSVELAMEGVDKLFLLNAVSADELTQALIALSAAKRSGIRHITYLSVLQVERFPDVPHFAAKRAVEIALEDSGVQHTNLRPGYFFQNDIWVKEAIMKAGRYPMPIGTAGIAGIDARDIAEAAAITLSNEGHDGKTYDLTSAQLLSGPHNAAVWSKLLGRDVHYGGHDFDAFQQHLQTYLPAWNAFDISKMFQGFFERGMTTTDVEVSRLSKLLGHAPRTYQQFAEEVAGEWSAESDGARP